MPLHIEFSLEYGVRRDDEAKVFVAYVPALQIYGQSKDEAKLDAMINKGIMTFLRLCHERGVLSDAMRERGMLPGSMATNAEEVKREIVKRGAKQYIIVGNLAQESYEVPVSLLAGKQALATCHH